MMEIKYVTLVPTPNGVLGTTYLNLGLWELAKAEFLRALQLEANHSLARRQLVGLYLRTGDRSLAAREAERALQRDPKDLRMAMALARAQTEIFHRENQSSRRTSFLSAIIDCPGICRNCNPHLP